MKRLVNDAENCTGCRACEMACSVAHDGAFSPALSRIRVVKLEQLGIDVPVSCRFCARPWCVAACPVGALAKDDKLARITVDAERCTGCRLCVEACPFGCVEMHPDREVPMICDLCDGRPQCVRRCATGGVRYRTVREQGHKKREELALGVAEDLLGQLDSGKRPYERKVEPKL